MRITGHPVVFGSKSVDLGNFVEVISPRAVDRALSQRADVVALRSHDVNMPLGRTSTGSLTLRKDSKGLAIDLMADESISYVADLARIMERGDAVGGSFAFRTIDDIWTIGADGIPHREVLDMHISEVSVGVVFPAYKSTNLIAHRSANAAKNHVPTVTTTSSSERQRRIAAAFK